MYIPIWLVVVHLKQKSASSNRTGTLLSYTVTEHMLESNCSIPTYAQSRYNNSFYRSAKGPSIIKDFCAKYEKQMPAKFVKCLIFKVRILSTYRLRVYL